MFNSNAFDYINVLDKAADAAWLRNDLLANNIANQSTPNYKRQDVDFESQLSEALKHQKYTSIDQKVANLKLKRLDGKIYTDYADYAYRMDGNNVDPEQEQVKLAANQMKYQGLTQSINQEFSNMKLVMK